LEGILGFRKQGNTLFVEPRAPSSWPGYTIEYRFGSSVYVITVRHEAGTPWNAGEVTVDGQASPDGGIALADDGRRHEVAVEPFKPVSALEETSERQS
jgi:cellobiose phosphorylase